MKGEYIRLGNLSLSFTFWWVFDVLTPFIQNFWLEMDEFLRHMRMGEAMVSRMGVCDSRRSQRKGKRTVMGITVRLVAVLVLCTVTSSAWAKLDTLKILTLERNARLCGYWARVGEMTGYNALRAKVNFMENAEGYGANETQIRRLSLTWASGGQEAMAQGWAPGARMTRADYASMEQTLSQCEQRTISRPVRRKSASRSLSN